MENQQVFRCSELECIGKTCFFSEKELKIHKRLYHKRRNVTNDDIYEWGIQVPTIPFNNFQKRIHKNKINLNKKYQIVNSVSL